jgi:hypothetical protein
MKKIIRLTEADLTRLVRRVIKEQGDPQDKVNSSIQQKSQGKLQNIKDRIMSKFANTPPPSLEDVKVFNQVKKELSSVVKPTVNSEDELSFTAKYPEGNGNKHIPVAPGTDFYFDFRPAGVGRTFSQKPERYKLGNTMANMSAENPEIDKLIRQLPGYRSDGFSEFNINTENMGDLLPKIKNILAKASQVGVQDFSRLYPTKDRSIVPQGRQRR